MNGSTCSVQPGGSVQGRGKTRARYGGPSSRKAHLEDYRVAPHSPRSVPRTFYIKSDPELIQDSFLSFELLLSCSRRNISVPVQNLVQSSQVRGVANMPKPLEGAMNS
ncbi:hypothetical protein O181_066341 [Austropuccinia psidii MF-1]|uniref:Uncharacterized protein n=1 Tax=Austropuccinia psidii MF-1 TaxID=1389203 RepID=A0A9Q3EXH1_9BASI|nr:hypothetical protein [Austropuccinia psidii MF-1]